MAAYVALLATPAWYSANTGDYVREHVRYPTVEYLPRRERCERGCDDHWYTMGRWTRGAAGMFGIAPLSNCRRYYGVYWAAYLLRALGLAERQSDYSYVVGINPCDPEGSS